MISYSKIEFLYLWLPCVFTFFNYYHLWTNWLGHLFNWIDLRFQIEKKKILLIFKLIVLSFKWNKKKIVLFSWFWLPKIYSKKGQEGTRFFFIWIHTRIYAITDFRARARINLLFTPPKLIFAESNLTK